MTESSVVSINSQFNITNQVEDIYAQLDLPILPKQLTYDIKFTIYICCIKNNYNFLGLDFINFANKLIKYCNALFGFNIIQACEVMQFYANHREWLFTFDIQFSDLVVFDWFGFFSNDVRFHIQQLEQNSEISLTHLYNPLSEEVNALLSKIQPYVKLEFRNIMVNYIYMINFHNDLTINSTDKDNINYFRGLTMWTGNTKGENIIKMYEDMLISMEFPCELYYE